MTRQSQWSAAMLLGGLSLAGLITASVAVSQEQKPPAVDPAGTPSIPAAPGAPLGISAGLGAPIPEKPTAPVAGGGVPALPPGTTPIPGGPTGILAIDPRPGSPPGAGNPNDATPAVGNTFQGMHENSTLQVISLKHANPQSVREIIEALMPAARGSVVVDARTNTLIVRVPQQTYEEIEQLVRILDAATPASGGGGLGSTITVTDKPRSGAAAANFIDLTTKPTAELRREYEQQDLATRELAEAIKRGAGGQAFREQLRARVGQAFAIRQQLLRAELAELQQRLKASQDSIDLRDRVGNQIIERRINELLDPSLQWEPASGLLSGTGTSAGMKGAGPTPARFSEDHIFREGSSDPRNRPVPTPEIVPTNPTRGKGVSANDFDPFKNSLEGSNAVLAPSPGSAPVLPPRTTTSESPFDQNEGAFGRPPRAEPVAPQPEAKPSEGTGTLRGRVIFEGSFTTPPALYKKGAAPKDTSICGADDIPDERVLVSNNGGLANVFVYLEKAPVGTTPPPIEGPLTLDQSGCLFQPHALIVRTDQAIQAINSDPIAHNVHTYPIKSGAFNSVLFPNDKKGIAVKYSMPEKQPIAVGCDIHPWMQAYHLPLDHSFGAVTDKEGAFEISGLPVGTHKFKVWHEVGKMLERNLEVTIKPGDNNAQIRVNADRLSLPLTVPGGGPNPKPHQGKSFSDDIFEDSTPRPRDPAEPFKNKI